ncbi:replication factor C large subunit [Candidatus Bathyarchaeota archaeon]|nr:MAG: replication factor C large subunit [Candidatus Bathyarchaeota archaeon]
MPDVPWVEKYRPRTLEEYVGNREAVDRVIRWLKNWGFGGGKKAALLYGPPGVGKTTLALILARMFDYDLVEMNASDWRTASAVARVAGRAAVQGTLYGRGRRIILIDEVDGIAGEDTGGLAALLKVIRETRNPMILVANDIWQPRFSILRGVCELIEFKRLGVRDIVKHLKRICMLEGIEADDEALKIIAKMSEGDMRSAVNDLQAVSYGRKRITVEDVAWLAARDRLFPIFDALKRVFYARTSTMAKTAINMVDMDPEMFFEWVYENAFRHFNDPEDLAEALENLALADLFLARVKRTQNWKLLSYALELMTAGVAAARKRSRTGWAPFKFPSRIRLLSTLKARRALLNQLAGKVGSKTHTSRVKTLRMHIPYLRVIAKSNPEMAKKVAESLELTDEELNLLSGVEPTVTTSARSYRSRSRRSRRRRR